MMRMEITPCDVGVYKFRVAKAKRYHNGNWYHVGFPRFFVTLAEALEFSKANRY